MPQLLDVWAMSQIASPTYYVGFQIWQEGCRVFFFLSRSFILYSVHILFIKPYKACAWGTESDGGAPVIHSLWCDEQSSHWGVALCGPYLEMDEAFSLGSPAFCAVVLGNLYSVTAFTEAIYLIAWSTRLRPELVGNAIRSCSMMEAVCVGGLEMRKKKA